MRYGIVLLCMSIACFANAQKNMHYSGSVEGGILKGSKPASSFVYTTQGVAYKQYAFSLGSGFDFYPFRSIPLFADAKKSFAGKNVKPFIQASAGVNFTSAQSKDATLFHAYAGDGHFNNGLFARGGAGLLFRAQRQCKVSLAAGYSFKTTSYKYRALEGTPWAWQLQLQKDVFHFNRWYAGVGVWW